MDARFPLTADAWTAFGLQNVHLLSAPVDYLGDAVTPQVQFPPLNAGISFYSAAVTIAPSTGDIVSISGPIEVVTQ